MEKEMKNRIISILLLLSLVFNIQGVTPAFAEETTTINNSPCKIEYFVRDSWGQTQMIEIKITNTSNKDLEGWGIEFPAEGKIENLWGASIYKHENGRYILEGNQDIAVIKPNMSATIGYKYISGSKETPIIQLCSVRTELKSGYDVTVKKMSGWDTKGIIELTITNSTEKPIKYWELDFHADFAITEVWNGSLEEQKGNVCKIKGSDNTQIILPKKSVTVGMQCSDITNLELKETELTVTVLERDLSPSLLSLSGIYAEYKEAFELTWKSDITYGTFTLLKSVDGITFAQISSVTDKENYTYQLGNPKENSYYFKIVQQTSDGQNIESNLLFMKKVGNSYEPDPIDMDGDGLSDLFEINIGTNYRKQDTDEDDLTDYQEYYFTHTDPLNVDTDGNSVRDALEDPDNDGISNLKEVSLGLNPLFDDTDNDGLKDGDEISKNKTDPSKYDTDEDGIGDGDEIGIHLDPINPKTHGIPDGDYTFEQTINEDTLSEINKDNDYELSVNIKAAGDVGKTIEIKESAYKQAMSNNDAVIGKIVELSYEDFKVDSAELRFKINNDVVEHCTNNYVDEPSLTGIQRFQIFHYNEELNILYPIKTEFDTNNNTVTVNSLELGSYCIIDMNRWMYGLGIRPAIESDQELPVDNEIPALINETVEPQISTGEQLIEPVLQSDKYDEFLFTQITESLSSSPAAISFNEEVRPEYNRQIDLVFAIDTSGSMDYYMRSYKLKLKQLIKKLYESGITANVAVISFGDYRQDVKTMEIGNRKWAKTPDEAYSLISQVEMDGWGLENHLDAFEIVRGLPFRQSAVKFAVLLSDEEIILENNICNKTTEKVAEELKKDGIITSVISVFSESFEPLYQMTGGTQANLQREFNQHLYDFIHQYIVNMKGFNFIGATDLCSKMLSEPLKRGGNTDTDGDTLTDSDEIDWVAIDALVKNSTDAEGNVLALPTFNDLVNYEFELRPEGFSRFSQHYQKSISDINILPIKSDPTSEDGDNDGILDINDQPDPKCDRYKEINPLKKDTLETIFKLDYENQPDNAMFNPIYLDIKENTVTIHARIRFFDEVTANKLFPGTSKTYAQVAEEGIKEKWSTTLTGSNYDFMPGLTGSVVVNIDASVGGGSIIPQSEQNRYINVEILEEFAVSEASDYVDGRKQWDRSFGSIIKMYRGYFNRRYRENVFGSPNFDTSKKENNYEYTEKQYKGTIAHEFGHALGLGDAYPDIDKGQPELSNKEVCGGANGNIMYNNGIVYNNDVEMMLQAFSENKKQYFRNDSPQLKSIVLRLP